MTEFLEIISVIILVFVLPLIISLKMFKKYLGKKSGYTAEEFERNEKYFPEVNIFLISIASALMSAAISYIFYLIFLNKRMSAAFGISAIGSAYFGAILPFVVLWYKLIGKQQNVKASLERYASGWALLLLVFAIVPNFLIKTFGMALCLIILAQIAVYLIPLLKKKK